MVTLSLSRLVSSFRSYFYYIVTSRRCRSHAMPPLLLYDSSLYSWFYFPYIYTISFALSRAPLSRVLLIKSLLSRHGTRIYGSNSTNCWCYRAAILLLCSDPSRADSGLGGAAVAGWHYRLIIIINIIISFLLLYNILFILVAIVVSSVTCLFEMFDVTQASLFFAVSSGVSLNFSVHLRFSYDYVLFVCFLFVFLYFSYIIFCLILLLSS